MGNRERYSTDIEVIMRDSLLKENIKFVEQYPIRCKYGYLLDFAIPNLKIDIECDGLHWHKKNNKHDRNRNWFLRDNKWFILRFTDKQIKEEINTCITRIKEAIERRLKENENKSKS